MRRRGVTVQMGHYVRGDAFYESKPASLPSQVALETDAFCFYL